MGYIHFCYLKYSFFGWGGGRKPKVGRVPVYVLQLLSFCARALKEHGPVRLKSLHRTRVLLLVGTAAAIVATMRPNTTTIDRVFIFLQ